MKTHPLLIGKLLRQPELAAGFQKGISAEDIGLYKRTWTMDRAIHMGFGGKVHHSVDLVLAQQPVNQRLVANITLDEFVSAGIRQVFQIFQAARVG